MFSKPRAASRSVVTALILCLGGLGTLPGSSHLSAASGPVLPNPILFVTQVPVPADFTTIGSVFGNHLPDFDSAPRGGDLWIRYPDGSLKNLTVAAGYGQVGFQGTGAIAVREPTAHWNGTKAVFSMLVGATPQQYQYTSHFWQLYEISRLGPTDTPVIAKVPNQPSTYNNVSPIYGTDDRIIFTSDRPRSGESHLHPQLDEYEEAPSTTGLWSLDPATGDLFLLEHSPSGSFTPLIDSFGRVIFTRWDHLVRDQQADTDAIAGGDYGTFNYADESATAAALLNRDEVFPEPRAERTDLLADTNLYGHEFNHFFPWQINEDGTEAETLNHIGRHELHHYFAPSLTDDSNLEEFIESVAPVRTNPNPIDNLLQMSEDPVSAGVYYGIDAPEFYTHASGQIVRLDGPEGLEASRMAVTYVTHRDTNTTSASPGPNHSGHYRNPLPLAGGAFVAVHTPETRDDRNDGTRAFPLSRYDFRLKTLKQLGNGYWVPDQPLTDGISAMVTYWDPDVLVTYDGPLWELDPVEVRVRPRPPRRASTLQAPELQMLAQENVHLPALQRYLVQHDLALIVSHDVTTRDEADRQQPFNLRVAGTSTETVATPGKIYDVALLQLFQGDQIRGLGGTASPRSGRRVLAQPLHTPGLPNPPSGSSVAGSVALGADGSLAAFVPARRALTWQLTDAAGTGVVRERYWLSFQPGEIRVCASCHGVNERDQAGQPPPINPPEALGRLLRFWKQATNDPDGDGLPTVWEEQFGLDANAGGAADGAAGDPDGDGKTNLEEYADGTHPRGFNTRLFAEGATGPLFDTELALANPDPDGAAAVLLRFLAVDGATASQFLSVPPLTRVSFDPESLGGLSHAEFSTVVESDRLVVADRTMSWDARGYGSHAESAVDQPATTWYLAEGATHSSFDLYYLLQNPTANPAAVEISYLRPAPLAPIIKEYIIGPASRRTIRVNSESPELAAAEVSGIVTSTDGVPILVERAMYLSTPGRLFDAGHASAGLRTASTEWYLAEGATGDYFDLFVLLANPSESDATVELRYLLPNGNEVTRTHVVPGLSRVTVWVDREDPRLASTAVSTAVTSLNGVPVLAERTMWWPGPTAASWQEAHGSAGATRTGTRWAFAAGELGGPRELETYVLIANTASSSGVVRVTLLFEDGTSSARSFTVAPRSRFNVAVAVEFPEAVDRRFGGLVESLGATPAEIVVERAMYSDADGTVWAAGTNALATLLN